MKRCTAKGFGLKSDEVCDRKALEIAAMQNHYVNVNPKGFVKTDEVRFCKGGVFTV